MNRACRRAGAKHNPGIEIIGTFKPGPAVIGARCAEIDLLPHILAHIGNVQGPKPAVEAVSKRVAQTKSIDLVCTSNTDKRVVGRDGIVARGVPRKGVDCYVKSEDLPQQIVAILRGKPARAAVTKRSV